jgi:hypothetical protein
MDGKGWCICWYYWPLSIYTFILEMGLCLSTAYIIFYYLENKKVSELDEAQMETLERILGEPESIMMLL